ncbi:hypothetical protein PIB30_113208, partial [Stylosanthes scabra]|nr:hypothetical protein [Stylosanthes scabra]
NFRHVGIDSGSPRVDSHNSLKFILKAGVDSGHSESTPCNVSKLKSFLSKLESTLEPFRVYSCHLEIVESEVTLMRVDSEGLESIL